MKWTDEKDDMLKRLHSEGHSCSTIASFIGGVSRNAVIGRIHRLKLPGRTGGRKPGISPSHLRAKLAAKRKAARPKGKPFVFGTTPKIPTSPIPPAAEYDVARVSFVENNGCKWPVGDPAVAGHDKPLFCGLKRLIGLPYCEPHALRAGLVRSVALAKFEAAQVKELQVA